MASRGFPDRNTQQNCQENPWDADDKKGVSPAENLVNPAAGEVTEQNTNRYAKGIDTEGSGSLARDKVVSQQGVGRGASASFANAHTNSGCKQLPEICGQARQCCHQAPDT